MAGKYSLTLQLQLQSPNNVAQVVSSLQKQLGGVAVNLQVKNSKQAVQQVQQLTNATNAAQSAAEKMGDAFGVSLKRFAAFSLASRAIGVFTRYLSNAVDESIVFDRQLNKIKQVTRASIGQLGDLSKEITRLATTFGVASNEITETALILAQAGLSATDTKIALEALTKTRLSATFGDINETAEGAVALIAQFGEGAGALERQLGALNSVSAKFAVESADLIEVIRRTGGVFKASGGSLEELFGLFTSVRATTRESAESIATALKTIFTRIQRPQTIEYLKQLGVELVNSEGAFIGPYEAIRKLSTAFGGLEQGSLKFIEIAEELGGYRQIGKVIPLLQQFATAERARQAALSGGASLTEEAAIAQESLAVQFQRVREEFLSLIRSTTQTESFKILTKTVLSLASGLIKVAEALQPVLPLLTAFAAIKFTRNIGGFFGGIGQALQKKQFGGKIHAFARGGMVPGSGNRDTVPAMLSPGEFVIRKSSVNKIGAGTLAAMNENRYAGGGKIIDEDQVGAAVAGRVSEKEKSKTVSVTFGLDDMLKKDVGVGKRSIEKSFYNTPREDLKKIISENYLRTNQGYRIAKSFNLKADGFGQEEEKAFQSIANEESKNYISRAAQRFASTVGVSLPSSNVDFAENYELSGSQKGTLFEDIISAFNGQPVSKQASENNRPFDFKNGIKSGKLFKDLIGINYIDAKNSTSNKNISGPEFTKKIFNQAILEAHDVVESKIGALQKATPKGSQTTESKKYASTQQLSSIFGASNRLKLRDIQRGLPGSTIGDMQLRQLGYTPVKKNGEPWTTQTKIDTYWQKPEAFAKGGAAPSDTVPALLTPGEFVINKSSAQRIGYGNLNRMNKKGVQGFAKGGSVGGVQKFADGGETWFSRLADRVGDALNGLVDIFTGAGKKIEQTSTPAARPFATPKGAIQEARISRKSELESRLSVAQGEYEKAAAIGDTKQMGRKAIEIETIKKNIDTLSKHIEKNSKSVDSNSKAQDKNAASTAKVAAAVAATGGGAVAGGTTTPAADGTKTKRSFDPATAFIGIGILQSTLVNMADSAGYGNESLKAFSNGLVEVTTSVGLLGTQFLSTIDNLKEQGKSTTFTAWAGGLIAAGAAVTTAWKVVANQGAETAKKQYEAAANNVKSVEDFEKVKQAGEANVKAKKTATIAGGFGDVATFAGIGAMVGSAIPVVGTALGGLAGAIAGVIKGLYTWLSFNDQAAVEEQNRANADAAAASAAKLSEQAFKDLERGAAKFAGAQGLGAFATSIGKVNKLQMENANKVGVSQEVRQKAEEESSQRIMQSASEIGKRAATEDEARQVIEKMAIESGFTGEKLKRLKDDATKAAASVIALRNAQQELTKITIENTRLSSAFNSAALAVDGFMSSLQIGSVGLTNTIASLEAAASNVNMGPEGEKAIAEIERAATSQLGGGFGDIAKNQANRARVGLALSGNLATALQGVSGSLVAGENSQNKDRVKEALLATIPEGVDSDTKAKLEALITSQVNDLDLTSGTIPVDQLMSSLQGQIKTSFIDPLSETGKALAQQQQRLVELTRTRIEAENRLVEAQKASLDLQLESQKTIAEFGGKKVTPADEFAIRAKQFDVGGRAAGLGGVGAGTAADIRRVSGQIRTRFAAQQSQLGGGGQGGGAAELDKDQREKIKKANQDLISLTRQRIEQTKQELAIIKEKNALEKSSIDKLLGGDVEGFMQDQAAASAAQALRSGNTDMLGMFSAQTLGQAAKSLEGQLTPQEFASALGPVLSRFGIQDSRSAQVFAGATREEQTLMQRGQEEAKLLSELGQNEVGFAQMELKSAEMNIQTANIKFQGALKEAQARDKAAQDELANRKAVAKENEPLRDMERQLKAAKEDKETADKQAATMSERAVKRENAPLFSAERGGIFGLSRTEKERLEGEESAAYQAAQSAQAEVERLQKELDEMKKKQGQGETAVMKARGGMIYANRGIFVPRGTDTVPAMLTPGEFVVRREAVQSGNNLQILQAMNRGGANSVLSNGVQALAGGGTVQNITNNNNNINVEQFSSAVNKLQEAISQIPREFFHQFNGTTNMSVTGLAGLTDVMKNIASDAVTQMASKMKTDVTGNVQINGSVLG